MIPATSIYKAPQHPPYAYVQPYMGNHHDNQREIAETIVIGYNNLETLNKTTLPNISPQQADIIKHICQEILVSYDTIAWLNKEIIMIYNKALSIDLDTSGFNDILTIEQSLLSDCKRLRFIETHLLKNIYKQNQEENSLDEYLERKIEHVTEINQADIHVGDIGGHRKQQCLQLIQVLDSQIEKKEIASNT